MSNVKNKVCLITGGAGGLGAEISEVLSLNGAAVFILDMEETKGSALAEKLNAEGGNARFEKIDLTSEEDWKRVVQSVVAQTGKIDVLVNNAGINIRKPIEEMNISEWNTMMTVNTGSVFLGCKYVIPVMRKQHSGAIINTSSVCGLVGHKYTPEAYTASKGAVTMLTKAVASRYAKDGIRSNSIHPSTVKTALVEKMLSDPQWCAERLGEVPLGRLCTAQDVAQAVLFLASEEASFINGAALTVDGGVTCY
ncbi:glucose 1-dehydrogenase [Treponema parvum]|uniref:Glucose 1-dehydrogenase n=1 Tax=Treponema parvum TaxID=138851 RepID=A0A975F2G2_9SPIR|nr:glucose 1-dehydrogenase [Treponema parvum]QTQ13316.1 glucose 1-dehydrogenase [Treponema parvum]